MRLLPASAIKGTWGTLLLPIQPDESIDWTRLADEIDLLLAANVAGIYSNGTACEFYAQSEEEFDRLQNLLATKCEQAGRPWQAGASHMDARICLERVRRVKQLHPSAIQVILPDWFPVTNAEAIRFLARVAEEAAPVGLVLYNPPHAKRALSPGDFGVLARAIPTLVGVKVPYSQTEWCSEFLAAAPSLSLFVPGHELATGISNGAHGAYSNVACLSPAGAVRWNRMIYADLPRALDLESRIQRFMSEYIMPFRWDHGVPNQGLDKLLAAIGGWAEIGTRLRWPYSWVPDEEVLLLRPIARELMPELFDGERN